MGVKVEKLGPESYSFQADEVNLDYLEPQTSWKRPLLYEVQWWFSAHYYPDLGTGKLSKPGGDKIGRRKNGHPLFWVSKNLEPNSTYDAANEIFHIDGKKSKGSIHVAGRSFCHWYCKHRDGRGDGRRQKPLFIMQPVSLTCSSFGDMLNRMGAKITGVGSNLLHIEGVKKTGWVPITPCFLIWSRLGPLLA